MRSNNPSPTTSPYLLSYPPTQPSMHSSFYQPTHQRNHLPAHTPIHSPSTYTYTPYTSKHSPYILHIHSFIHPPTHFPTIHVPSQPTYPLIIIHPVILHSLTLPTNKYESNIHFAPLAEKCSLTASTLVEVDGDLIFH